MARPAHAHARRQLGPLRARLVAAAWLAAAPALAADLPPTPTAPAPPDSLGLLAQAAGSGTASTTVGGRPGTARTPEGVIPLEPGSGLTIRRIANPHYRPPAEAGALLARPLATLVGSQYARVRLTRFETGAAPASTDWELVAGRERGARQRLEVWAQGYSSAAYDQLRMLRLSSLQGPLEWSMGDVSAPPIGMLPWVQRLRGGLVAHALSRGSDWRLLGGVVPTWTHGVTPNTALASLLVENVPIENGTLSYGLMGFGRRSPPPSGLATAGPDSLPGGGGAALYSAHIASRYGDVSSTFMAQLHDLDGSLSPAGVQALEWSLRRRRFAATVRDQIGTTNARQPGTEHLTQAPSHEARMSAQLRSAGGRAEMHLAGLSVEGNDVELAARTVQAGASGSLGASGWYSGLDFTWNRRAPVFADERRLAVQTGKVTEHGNAVRLGAERNTDNVGRDQITLDGEGSTSPRPDVRLAIEPRADWQAGRFDRALVSARMAWALFSPTTRMYATLALSSARSVQFRGEVAEASLALSFSPRARDRGTLEAHRYEEDAARSLEYTGSYDYLENLYSAPPGTLAGANTGTLTVTVVNADSATGVPEVLVSLDGKEFRFTDGDGVARFTNVPPGSHVVSIVERSLPASHKIVGDPTLFITIERGRTPQPVRFEIARPVRKVEF